MSPDHHAYIVCAGAGAPVADGQRQGVQLPAAFGDDTTKVHFARRQAFLAFTFFTLLSCIAFGNPNIMLAFGFGINRANCPGHDHAD
ncbi:hypothetical protein MMC14_009769 [Varicellaria rhodocarpa]|nr:hypothetical protein [Varicellaria rhodocarpa]